MRTRALMAGLVGLIALGLAVSAVRILPSGTARVYTVPEVATGLRAAPGRWLGRTILVQGLLFPVQRVCAPGTAPSLCMPAHWLELQPQSPPDVPARLVLRGSRRPAELAPPANPFISGALKIPPLRALIPPPWPACGPVYRIRLSPSIPATRTGGPAAVGTIL